MKPLKFLTSLFYALLMITGFTAAAPALNCDPAPVFYTLCGGTILYNVFANKIKDASGWSFHATIFKEVWTGEIIKRVGIIESFAWVNAIKQDYSRFVNVLNEEAQVIHLASFPVQPDVLIDNNTYPIPTQELTTSDIPLSLNKFQTKVTTVTDDALYANTTKPMMLHSEAHANSIMENKFALGAWNICPNGDTAAMPVMLATGDDDGTGRKKLTWDDVANYKRALDRALPKIPTMPGSRIMVLDQDHENDLGSVNQTFKDKFYDWATGKPYSALNFTFYSSQANPFYDLNSLTKNSFGVSEDNSMRRCTMFFSTHIAAKANGSTIAYLTPKTAEMQQNSMAVRHYHLITRLMNQCVGAIVSPNA